MDFAIRAGTKILWFSSSARPSNLPQATEISGFPSNGSARLVCPSQPPFKRGDPFKKSSDGSPTRSIGSAIKIGVKTIIFGTTIKTLSNQPLRPPRPSSGILHAALAMQFLRSPPIDPQGSSWGVRRIERAHPSASTLRTLPLYD